MPALAQDPPCETKIHSAFHEEDAGHVHWIVVDHNDVTSLAFTWRGFTESVNPNASPFRKQIDTACLLAGDSVTVVATKCGPTDTKQVAVSPPNMQPLLNAIVSAPGYEKNTVKIDWEMVNTNNRRLRAVVLRTGNVFLDKSGWGTVLGGTEWPSIPPGSRGPILVTAQSCGAFFASKVVYPDEEQDQCDTKAKDRPCECSLNPVNTFSGALRYEDTDVLPSSDFFPFRRTYLSRRDTAGFFGPRWFSAFDAELSTFDDIDGVRYVTIVTEDQATLVFARRGDVYIQMSPEDERPGTLLARADGSWALTDADARLTRVFGATGFPLAFVDAASGRAVQLSWTNGLPVQIADSWGRWTHTVTTNPVTRRITAIEVQGHPDLVWQYIYDHHLVRVDSPAGTWRSYEYALPDHPHDAKRLVRIRDGAGNVIEDHGYEYNYSGRAISSYGPDDEIDSIETALPGRSLSEYKSLIRYKTGRVETHYRRYVAGRWRTVEVDSGCTTCGSNITSVVLDGRGNVIRAQSSDGYITTNAYHPTTVALVSTRTGLRPVSCDPSTASDHCHLTSAALATSELIPTSATRETSFTYADANWPNAVSTTETSSVLHPGGTRRESFVYDAATGNVLSRSVTGWTGNPTHEETRTTTTVLYDGTEGAAFAPGGTFATAWLSLPQPRLRKITNGPRADVLDLTTYVYYPIDAAVPAAWRGQLAAVRNAAGLKTLSEAYDIFGNATRMVNMSGVAHERAYDLLGRLTSTTIKAVPGCDTVSDALCATDIMSSLAYSGAGPLTSELRPGGGVTAYTYDDRGRQRTLARGPSLTDLREQIEYSYDTLTGKRNSERHLSRQNGAWVEKKRVSHLFDTSARLRQTQHADGSSVAYEYDAGNRVRSVRDENHATSNTEYLYDPLGRVTKVRQRLVSAPAGWIETRFSYDVDGNLTSVIDPNGNLTTYVYDDFGAMLSQTSPVTGVVRYAYNADDQPTSLTDANSATTTRAYDSLGRPLTATATKGSASSLVTWTYDAGTFGHGQVATLTDPSGQTQYSYNRLGLLTRETKVIEGTSYVTTYGWDADSNRSRITYPSGRIVNFTFDHAGRVTTAAAASTALLSSATYLPFGPWVQLVLGNGTTRQRTYDSRYAITANEITGAAGPIASYAYDDDLSGNITAIRDLRDAAYDRTFAYDDLNRLVTANTGSGLWGTGAYSYDSMGNLLTAAIGNQSSIFTYLGTSPKMQQVNENGSLQSVMYDPAGNETMAAGTTSAYTPANQLESAGAYSYKYDGRGVRTVTRFAGGAIASLVVTPGSIVGGEALQATLTLTAPAPTGGAAVRITTDSAVLTVPNTVLVPAGSSSTTFGIQTVATASDASVAIRASLGREAYATVSVLSTCLLDRIELTPSAVVGGGSTSATVVLAASRSADQPISITSSNPVVAVAPASVVIPAGATSVTFQVATTAVGTTTDVTITASGCGSVSSSLTVQPATLQAITVTPPTILGGASATLSAIATGVAPAAGIVVNLTSSDPAAVGVPATVTISSGSSSAITTMTTVTRAADTTVLISGTASGITRSANLNILRCGAPPALPQFEPGEVVWFDDAPPAGAALNGNWTWDTTVYASGTRSLVDPAISGGHEQWFEAASDRMVPLAADRVFVYALLDPCNPPRAIMIGWGGSGWPRAYWGEDLFPYSPRTRIGNLPPVGRWVRLEVPAYLLGIGGQSIHGIALSVYGGRVWFDRAGKRACTLPNSSPSLTFPGNESVWFDDDPPTGAQLNGNWTWATDMKASGTRSHVEPPGVGGAEHFFTSATATIVPGPQEDLFVYAYLDPCDPPRAIMLGWNDGAAWPRAYWGEDLFPYSPRTRIGNLPDAGGWVKLAVPSTTLGLAGRTISGMAFSVYGGRAWFDRAGKNACTFPAPSPPTLVNGDVVWIDDNTPPGAALSGDWAWDTTQRASGTRSMSDPAWSGGREFWFTGATISMQAAANDKLFVYVLIDPCAPPREIMLGWNNTGWPRAYWGEDLFPYGPRTRIGNIPQAGGWVRLEIPASLIGPSGQTITGMAFSVHSGRAWFDLAGINQAGNATNPPMMSSSVATDTAPELRRFSMYTPELQLLAETGMTDTAVPQIAYEYVWFEGEPLVQIENTTGTLRWYFNDHLGTPLLTTDASGSIDWRIEREPYGNVRATRVGVNRHQPLGSPGHEDQGDGGRDYNIFRWYRSDWGRYTQADPLGVGGGMNLFGYVENNPVSMYDPLGLSPVPYKNQRYRPCNSAETAKCQATCKYGMESCRVSQIFQVVVAKPGKVLSKWVDGPISCSCKEPDCWDRLREWTDPKKWLDPNPAPPLPFLPIPPKWPTPRVIPGMPPFFINPCMLNPSLCDDGSGTA